MALQKTFLAKIYDQDNSTLLKVLTTDRPEVGSAMHLKNVPSFSSRINGGLGELILDVKTPFDSFEEGTTVEFMNIVKVYAVVRDNSGTSPSQTTTLIYTGFISRYEVYVEEGGEEGVRITCLGLVSLLTRSYYEDGDFTVVHTTQDPTVIGKAVIDNFLAVYGGSLLSYDASSVPATVGTNVSVTFTDQKWFDCLKKVGELCDEGWWWTIDRNGKYNLQAKPGSATRTFTIGKDVVSLHAPKDAEQVVNDLYVRRNGGTETHYEDATSQAEFGTGNPATGLCTEIVSDASLTSADAANQFGDKRIADTKDAKTSVSLVVNSKADLESIQVGQTCRIRHFNHANTFFSSNLMITALTYNGDTVSLELEQDNSDFGLELDSFVNG